MPTSLAAPQIRGPSTILLTDSYFKALDINNCICFPRQAWFRYEHAHCNAIIGLWVSVVLAKTCIQGCMVYIDTASICDET